MESTSQPGNVIGKYRLVAELGHGGMADVFLAASGGLGGFNKLSVLKLLRDLHEQTNVQMFLEEARLAARLNHPNVVHTHEVGNEGDQYFIAMEFIDGPALSKVRRRTKLPLPVSLHVLSMVLEGLRYAHALKDFDGTPLQLVHRDLSPQNVLVTYEGDCKIVDFGIAKAHDSSVVTRSGSFKGKVTYMPPEQARGVLVDQRADVFAVGAMLFEALSGRRLWQGEQELVVVQRLSAGEVPKLTPLPEVTRELAELCAWALEPDPEQRCPSAAMLQERLESVVRSAGLVASRRDLGELVAREFAADREKLQRTIAEQLREVVAKPTAEYRAVALPHASYGSGPASREDSTPGEPPGQDVVFSEAAGEVPLAVRVATPVSPRPVVAPSPRGLPRWLPAVVVAAIGAGFMAVLSLQTKDPVLPSLPVAKPATAPPIRVEAPKPAPPPPEPEPVGERAPEPAPPPRPPEAPKVRSAAKKPAPTTTPVRDDSPPDELGF